MMHTKDNYNALTPFQVSAVLQQKTTYGISDLDKLISAAYYCRFLLIGAHKIANCESLEEQPHETERKAVKTVQLLNQLYKNRYGPALLPSNYKLIKFSWQVPYTPQEREQLARIEKEIQTLSEDDKQTARMITMGAITTLVYDWAVYEDRGVRNPYPEILRGIKCASRYIEDLTGKGKFFTLNDIKDVKHKRKGHYEKI